jgi:hypothetical protein
MYMACYIYIVTLQVEIDASDELCNSLSGFWLAVGLLTAASRGRSRTNPGWSRWHPEIHRRAAEPQWHSTAVFVEVFVIDIALYCVLLLYKI